MNKMKMKEKKILSILLVAVMMIVVIPITGSKCYAKNSGALKCGTWSWDKNFLKDVYVCTNASCIYRNLKLSTDSGYFDGEKGLFKGTNKNSFTFKAIGGDFSRIEITCSDYLVDTDIWVPEGDKIVWTGKSNNVSLGLEVKGVTNITYTIVPADSPSK